MLITQSPSNPCLCNIVATVPSSTWRKRHVENLEALSYKNFTEQSKDAVVSSHNRVGFVACLSFAPLRRCNARLVLWTLRSKYCCCNGNYVVGYRGWELKGLNVASRKKSGMTSKKWPAVLKPNTNKETYCALHPEFITMFSFGNWKQEENEVRGSCLAKPDRLKYLPSCLFFFSFLSFRHVH